MDKAGEYVLLHSEWSLKLSSKLVHESILKFRCTKMNIQTPNRTENENINRALSLLGLLQVSTLKQHEFPEIWVAAGEGCSFLEKFSYVLSEKPSKGVLYSEDDRKVIKVAELHS